jgi:hypothetical protein
MAGKQGHRYSDMSSWYKKPRGTRRRRQCRTLNAVPTPQSLLPMAVLGQEQIYCVPLVGGYAGVENEVTRQRCQIARAHESLRLEYVVLPTLGDDDIVKFEIARSMRMRGVDKAIESAPLI